MKLGKHAWGIWGIALVVALAFAFLIPFTHNTVYFIALISMLLAFVLCAWSFWRSFDLKDELFSKYMGWPIFKVGLAALVAQLILGFGLMALAFLYPVYIALLLEIVLFAATGVCLIAREAARQVVEQSEQPLHDRTAVWKTIRARANALTAKKSDPELYKLVEDIRFADPTPCSLDAEIFNWLENISNDASSENIQKVFSLLRQRKSQIKEEKRT